MSNRAYLNATEFRNKMGSDYGWVLFDDYGKIYEDDRTSAILDCNDIDLLAEVVKDAIGKGQEIAMDLLSSLSLNKTGMFINDTWYDYSEIADILKEL